MEQQLMLIETRAADWRLDEHTREVGRVGLLHAREALRGAVADTDQLDAERHAA